MTFTYDKRILSAELLRIARSIFIFLSISIVTGCSGMLAYREGNSLVAQGKLEQGIGKLKEAVKNDPKNAEYRIALSTTRAMVINHIIDQGSIARREGRLDDAENAYRRAINMDLDNLMARQGLDAILMERRHKQITDELEVLLKKEGDSIFPVALEKIRAILSENKEHKLALNMKELIDEKMAKLSRSESKLADGFRRPISLQFRDAPLRSVFDVIAQVSGLNFFFDKEVRQDLTVTVSTKETSIEDVVHLLLTTNQLRQKILNSNSVLVYPNSPQKVKDYQSMVLRSFFLANADVKAVSNTIKTIVKTEDMVVDERLGIIILRDTPEAIRMAEKIVALQDISDPEVMLEVEIMEIKRSRLLELGIQWPGQLSLAPLQTSGVPLTLEALKNINSSTTQATIGGVNINARKEDQNANILANPRIRVRNKEKAKIVIGDRLPVITTTSTSTGFVAESVSYIDVGLKLEVEPNIYLDDEVAIKVNLEVSNLVREILSKAGTLSYQIGTRGANTVLRLKNGETQILAGLISDEDRSAANKVPGVGELPILGRLFGSQKDDSQRSEILLSITPRVVRSIRRPDLAAAEFDSGTSSNIGSRPLMIAPKIITPSESPAAPPVKVSP